MWKRFLACMLVVGAIASANAFKVAFVTVKSMNFMGSAIHERITWIGLSQVQVTLSNNKKVAFTIPATGLVVIANAETDSAYLDIPFVHFDNERFATAGRRLLVLRSAVGAKASTGDFVGARESLGQALHTVQDFYSHSTWVERGEPGLAPLGRQALQNPASTVANCGSASIIAPASLSSGYFNLSQVTPSLLIWTNQYRVLGIEPTWPYDKCIHGGGSGAGIHKDDPSKGDSFGIASEKAVAATRQYVEDIIGDLRKQPPAVADKAICGLFGIEEENCLNVDFLTTFSSRGTWIVETGMPAFFPVVLGAMEVDLADRGLAPGDVIELLSAGGYNTTGYWGFPTLVNGSIGIFRGAGGYLSPAAIGPGDPGTSPFVDPFVTPKCPDNAAGDTVSDFGIDHANFRRVRIPAGATHIALSVPDCFHGDNVGTMTVRIRKAL